MHKFVERPSSTVISPTMPLLSWRNTAGFVIVALVDFACLRTIDVVHASMKLKCEDQPPTSYYIKDGMGNCFLWGPDESPYDCCVFCDEAKSIASQYVRAGEVVPLGGFVHNSPICFCYQGGRIIEGDGVGSVYIMEED